MPNLKEYVKGNVEFVHFREGNFIYRTENGLEFPVPLSDIANATMQRTDKALLFMRYIRKHLELLNAPKATYQGSQLLAVEVPI
jgi:hypothetical protein